MTPLNPDLDPDLDLELVRHLKASPAKVWRCWTEPALLQQWFAPKPVVTRDVAIDLRPGGSFKTTMDVPGHGTMVGHGCILEVIVHKRLIWTDLMHGGYHPSTGGLGFTAILLLEPDGEGTLYRAIALHRTQSERAAHEEMGFHSGWGTAADQLDALAVTL